MKRYLAISLIFCIVFAFCGCSLASQADAVKVSQDDNNVIHLALNKDIKSPDVQVSGCSEIAESIYSRLVKISKDSNGNSNLVGDLAESWDISSDGTEYTFHLRENVLFSNGQCLEADDILYTIDRMLNPETNAISNEAAEHIYGAYDVMLGEKSSVENIGVFIIDKFTVKLVLRESWAPFLASLCDTSWSIYNRDAKTAGAYSIGTGPYVFDDWKAGEYVFLTANNDYFGGRPAIDGILYRIIPDFNTQLELFTAGELDIIKVQDPDTADLYLNDSECSNYIVAEKQLDIWYYAMNQNIAPFSDNIVRQGLQRSIDRKAILNSVFHNRGQVLNGIIPSGMQGYEQTTARLKYNVSEAVDLFREAGFAEGFNITICQTGTDEAENSINQLVSEQLALCDVVVNVKTMEPSAYYSLLTGGTLPMHLCHIVCDVNEPSILFSAFTSYGCARSSINCQNEDIVDRCSDAQKISDISARLAEYQNLEEVIIHDDAAIIPLFQLYSYVLINPRIDNFQKGTNSVSELSIIQ